MDSQATEANVNAENDDTPMLNPGEEEDDGIAHAMKQARSRDLSGGEGIIVNRETYARPVASDSQEQGFARTTCPHCSTWLDFTQDLLGQSIECPACGVEFELSARIVSEPPPPSSWA